MLVGDQNPGRRPQREWPRAAALFAVASLSVLQPSALVAIPFLILLGLKGIRGGVAFLFAVIAMVVATWGPRDGVWYVERAWGLLIAGWFVGLTMLRPRWQLLQRTLAAVIGSVIVGAAYLGIRNGAWVTLDWTIRDRLMGSAATALDAVALFRGGSPLSPAFAAAMYDMAEVQALVFPALVGIGSMAALAVAWWLFMRLTVGGANAIAPVRTFRFNDHLVWVMIGGLLLLLTDRWGEGLARLGANAVVFMGALYALRGAGVVMFVSGGLSLVGYALFALGMLVGAPYVLAAAILVGIGDTWLDLRARVQAPSA